MNPPASDSFSARLRGGIHQAWPSGALRSELLGNVLEEELARFVFGSNAIEKAGTSERSTFELCMQIFHEEPIDPDHIDEQDKDYLQELEHVLHVNEAGDGKASVIRGRWEAINHAKAAKHLLGAVIDRHEPLTEKLLCETHQILLEKSEHEADGGIYREAPCAATSNSEMYIEPDDVYSKRAESIRKIKGTMTTKVERIVRPKFMSTFLRHQSIRPHMKILVDSFNDDVAEAEISRTIDPTALASRYCNYFVCIHPFVDGNGRMCRLLLNAILIKYTGICVTIGAYAEEREKYTMLAWRANKKFQEEDRDDIPLRAQKCCVELSELVLDKVTERLSKANNKLGSGCSSN